MNTPSSQRFHLAAVILAAGRSSRAGRPKLLLPWGNTSILGHLVRTWNSLGAQQLVVVSRPADTGLEMELKSLAGASVEQVINPNADEGMFSSIRAAAQWHGWEPVISNWAIVLGDQPHLRPATLEALVQACENEPWQAHQPCRHGEPRHPVLLPGGLFRELAAGDLAALTLKDFLSAHPVALTELDDPGLDLDIDTVADYEAALRLADLNGLGNRPAPASPPP